MPTLPTCTKAEHQEIMVTTDRALLERRATFVRLTSDGAGGELELWECRACGKLVARARGRLSPAPVKRWRDPDSETTAVEICADCLHPVRGCTCAASRALEACGKARTALRTAARANGVLATLVAAMLARR